MTRSAMTLVLAACASGGGGGADQWVELKTEATLEFTSDSAVFGALAATKMFCGEAVTNQENEYLGALDAAERGEITEPFLFIYAAGRPEPLRFVRE